jgi:PAS domain S-box-containing protein
MRLMSFDFHTVIILLFVGNLVVLAMLLAYRGDSVSLRPFRRFLEGKLLQSFAWLFLGLRGGIPDPLSACIGDTILLAGLALEILAIATVDAPDRLKDRIFFALAVAGISAFWIFGRTPGMMLAVASTAMFALYAAVAVILLRDAWFSRLRLVMGLFFAAFCVLLAMRPAIAFFMQSGPEGLMHPHLTQTLNFLVLFLFMLTGGVGFLLMLKELADRKLARSEEKYRTLVERASETIFIVQDGRIVFANRKVADTLGVEKHRLMGAPLSDYIFQDDRATVMSAHEMRTAGESAPDSYETRIVRADGSAIWMLVSATRVQWDGRPASLGLLTDITAQKRAEDGIRRLLEEKDLVLREVHHRIKNNMNTIMALLNMQSASVAEPAARTALNDARDRLRSMALLYDKLYRSGGFQEMPVKEFLPVLLSEAAEVFPNSERVALEVDAGDFILDAKTLSSLGIIVNELVTNSMKHAFIGREHGRIRLSASLDDGLVTIAFEDDGIGMPDSVRGATAGFGMQLVDLLVRQVGGSMRRREEEGTKYVLEFRPPESGKGPGGPSA